MFGKTKKENKNYYVSPLPEAFLSKAAVRASVIAIAAALPFIAALVLWIYPGIGSLLWIYGYYEAMVAYWALFTCSGIGLVVCAVMSFFGYKLRKEVMQKSAPTFGFRKSSYNGNSSPRFSFHCSWSFRSCCSSGITFRSEAGI